MLVRKRFCVDGVKSLSPKARFRLVTKLKPGIKVKPTRRVWIPKPGTDEKRPLGIPTMYDRAKKSATQDGSRARMGSTILPCLIWVQTWALHVTMRLKQYSSVLDASQNLCLMLTFLSASTASTMKHCARKLNTSPTILRQVRAWLKAGVMDKGQLFPTSEGTPPCGVISPFLANVALHGMEERIKSEFPKLKLRDRETWFHKKGSNFNPPYIIRYADDFVIHSR
jgi:RNA-directed DNA polymerase